MVNITGRIYYLDTKLPIVGAIVQIENSYTDEYVKTDAKGFFSIPVTGMQTLIFSHENTNQIVKKAVSDKMDIKDIGIIYMMNDVKDNTTTPECPAVQLPPNNNTKKVVLGFIAGLIIGKLVSNK